MFNFRVFPIPNSVALRIREDKIDDFGHRLSVSVASENDTGPCRNCLYMDESIKENLLDAFCRKDTMDTDLDQMTREELVAEVKSLRQGIRQHRDSNRHELCWHHPSLWDLLPEKTDPIPVVPDWPQFIEGCVKYRQSLDDQAPNAPRTKKSYQE